MQGERNDEEAGGSPSRSSEQLGRIVKGRRAWSGWTQADLAEQMNAHGFSWHQSTVNRVETGLRPFTWDEAVTLAVLLDLDLSTAADEQQRLRSEHAEVVRQIAELGEQLQTLSKRESDIYKQLEAMDITDEQAEIVEHVQRAAKAKGRKRT